MKSLQGNPECQPLNVTSVSLALNYHIFSVVALQHRQAHLSLYRENNTVACAKSNLNGKESHTEINAMTNNSENVPCCVWSN